MKMLSISLCVELQALYFVAPSKTFAIERLFNLCKEYNTNLHLLAFDYSNESIEYIDNLYTLIISI